MLFNSWEFLFIFLPVVVFGYYFFGGRWSLNMGLIWLVLSSLFFYGWWNPSYVPLILTSIFFNFLCGKKLARFNEIESRLKCLSQNLKVEARGGSCVTHTATTKKRRISGFGIGSKFLVLVLGLSFNLGLLLYYKYACFFLENVNIVVGSSFEIPSIVLPLAISFFTFQQIAYLVDEYYGSGSRYTFTSYMLFVLFFPQLIAGPIVQHREILPQFLKSSSRLFRFHNFRIGLTYLVLGLFKKVCLADSLARFSSPVFGAALNGTDIGFIDAWCGSIGYTLQLYFDFSGYSDMAIGLGLFFNVKLPINFNSPLKSRSIIEFWQRWNITLSRFVSVYLHIPMVRLFHRPSHTIVMLCTFVSMTLMGVWHGAGWTFVGFGVVHAISVIAGQTWKRKRMRMPKPLAWFLAFNVINLALVLFRAESFEAAWLVLAKMFDLSLLTRDVVWLSGVIPDHNLALLAVLSLLFVVLFCPNTHEIMDYDGLDLDKGRIRPISQALFKWQFMAKYGFLLGVVFAVVLLTLFSGLSSEFLYFQF